MFDLSRFFSWYKVDSIRFTNHNKRRGFGVLTTDQLDTNKLKLSEITNETKNKIKK